MTCPLPVALALAVGYVAANACLHGQPVIAPNRVCFVDEAERDQSLVRYREELRAALKTRDLEQIRPRIGPSVTLGHYGVQRLNLLDVLADRNNVYWNELADALAHGGVFQSNGSFCSPFYSCPSPPQWDPAFVLILGTDVPAYAQPSAASPVVARLSCDVVKALIGADGLPPETPETAQWTGIWTPSGQRAFVRNTQVAQPSTYVHLAKRKGQWFLVGIGGGD